MLTTPLRSGEGNNRSISSPHALLRGRYSLHGVIGEGQYGRVYLARDVMQGNCPVALKQMKLSGLTWEERTVAQAQFRQEARMLADLHHPGIPSLRDAFVLGQRWYLVTDYVEGETLEARLLRLGRLACGDALAIARDLCAVLVYLHDSGVGILHRDIKPANILLGDNGSLSLLDFGIACPMRGASVPDFITSGYGTPGYAPPEQYGNGRRCPRSDIYSLGATLHQMLSGKPPGASPFHFAPLETWLVPPAVSWLISRMVALRARKRPGSTACVYGRLSEMAQVYEGYIPAH